VLLWDGQRGPRYLSEQSRESTALGAGDKVLAWKAKVSSELPARLAARGVQVGEIEDGMVRSAGLGANCVPPLSIAVDMLGAHFDPAQPSRLEQILQGGAVTPAEAERARALRARLVASGISKYGRDTSRLAPEPEPRRRILVTGQVEDDRAMQLGGAGCTNLDLVRRTRELEPAAYLIYKPHPDVEAGHRKGHVPDPEILAYADEVDRDSSIQALLDSVVGVHVITSLAGFEALMRGREVTTHGVPFYAGWGLTRDVGPVPQRRSRRCTLDELVAAALILYPRYIDPVTRLPCPAEVTVERLAADQARARSPLVALRRAQGQLKLVLGRFRGEIE
jgi:capsular polysaccharide export protein